MRKSKGISMISLIVTIIVIILLASMAIGTGTKYLKESRNRDKTNFISVLSSAVSKRHEDTNVSSLMYPYVGYYINDSTIFEKIFAPKINEPVTFENGIWYIVDTATATSLGVKEPENYINTIDEGYTEEVTVALVNYATGDVYLIDVYASELGGLDISKDNLVTGHTHRYTDSDPTCTEPVKCADCGFILKEPLGHVYDPTAGPIPVAGDEENSHYNKVCTRCGMAGGYEPHTYEYVHIEEGGVWYHDIACSVCGYVKAVREVCTVQYSLPETDAEKATSHIKKCRYCGHSVTESHDMAYREISESMHEKYCNNVNCSYVILTELHVDDDNDDFCDLCNAAIIDYSYPVLGTVTMVNKSATTDDGKYVAKYEDTIELVIVADKPIQNLVITIGGQIVPPENMTTTDNITWVIEYELDPTNPIPDGNISININCESTEGVELLTPVTKPTDGKNIIFDGTQPELDYIDKDTRAEEEN